MVNAERTFDLPALIKQPASLITLACLLFALIALPASAGEAITLSPTIDAPRTSLALDEQTTQWLKEKGVLTLGISRENFEPYEVIQGRSFKGVVADYVNLIAKSLNLTPKVLVYPDWKSAQHALEQGDVDALSRGLASDNNADFLQSNPYVLKAPVIVGRGTELAYSKIKIQGEVATSGNFVSSNEIRNTIEKTSPIVFPSALEALHAVEYRRHRWFIGDPMVVGYFKAQGELQHLYIYPSKNLAENGYGFVLNKSQERLRDLFNQVLEKTRLSQKNKILNYWAANITVEHPANIAFTAEEQEWLATHPDVVVGVNSALPPYSFYDDAGELRGVMIDLLAEISQRLGINFTLVDLPSLGELEESLRAKHVDMAMTLLPNAERATYLNFTAPYLFNSFSLVTRKDSPITNMVDLNGAKVAIQRSNLVTAKVMQARTSTQLIKKDSQLDSLVAVANGEADAAITLLPTATYLIRQYFADDLRVATSLPDIPADLPFSIQADQTTLYSVMSKVIEQLGQNQINGLMNNWKAAAPAQPSTWKKYTDSFRLLSIFTGLSSLLLIGFILYLYIKRRHTQREAEHFEFRSTLLDSIPMAISVRDRQGRFLFCNQVFYSQTRSQPNEVIGKRTFDFLALERESAEEHQRQYFQTLKNGQADQRQFDVNINGAHLTFRQWDRPYTDKKGTIAGLISGYADMTATVLLQQQLRDSYDQAVRANEAKSRFLAVMSHEIRTPLNAIIGLLELTLHRMQRGVAWEQEDLQVAFGSSKSLIALIDDILDLAKIESGKLSLMPQRCNLTEITQAVTRVFSGVARQKGLYLHLQENLQSSSDIALDEGRLKQVLSNLLSNAIKFTDRGGVEITVSNTRVANEAHITIEIVDTGIGISSEDQQQLFKPFTQAGSINHARGGTGLGLVICRQLVDMMGGTLELDSSLGHGCRVVINLTAPELEPSATAPAPAATRLAANEKLAVLLVDDHPANRLLLGQQLEFLGHTVQEAEEGSQALELLHQHPFDLIITDCSMPVMDGYELSRQWRRHEAQTGQSPCWIMGFTANAQPEETARCIEAGMDGCLFKPVSLAELAACIENLTPRPAGSVETLPPVPAQYAELIDKASIAGITNGNEKLADMLMTQLYTSNKLDLQQLNTKIEESQWRDIGLLAHRLKGVARLINSKALIEATVTYEASIDNANSEGQKQALAINIRLELERLQAALSNELKTT